MVVALTVKLWLPQPVGSGTITQLSHLIELPFPHREAVVVGRETIQAVMYETQIPYQLGERVLYRLEGESYVVTEKLRLVPIVQLSMLFVGIIGVVAGGAGLRSLLGLIFSFAIIFRMVLPQILAGVGPVRVALSASAIILLFSYYLTHGISTKTTIAMVATLLALGITGVVAENFAGWMQLSGLGGEEAGFLLSQLPIETFYQLLLAGVIIGSLGVLDDITISQAAIVEELSRANTKLGVKELFVRAMRVGHDHIGSLVNTLVLVYAGSALPLLLLFVVNQGGWQDLLNYELVSEEILKTLSGSIGLITAVPITTLIAAYWYGKRAPTL